MPKALVYSADADRFAAPLRTHASDWDIATASTPEQALDAAPEVEVLISLGHELSEEVLTAMTRLRWVQLLSAGADSLLALDALKDDVAVTTLSGAHGPQMSELAVLMMLALPRRLRQTLKNQSDHLWKRRGNPTLEGKRLCILGLGAIAEALIARVRPFGVIVTGVSDGRDRMEGVERIHPYADLATAAADADFLCVLAPLDSRSRGIVGQEVLRALGPQGILISMGRGPVVDEAALVRALEAGEVGGAGLDVFEVEPLPKSSPLWDMENVLVTPHVGGLSDHYPDQAAPIVAGNLSRWARNGPDGLANRVR